MGIPQRRQLLVCTALALGVLTATAWLAEGWSEEAVRGVVRGTAKLAIVLFSAAFGASSLHALWRGRFSSWALANRRHLGLSFALTHSLHLAALIALGLSFPEPFVSDLNGVTLIGGGLAYLFIFAMAATSNDVAVRWLGRRRWRRLHVVGGWYVLAIFAQSYLPRAFVGAELDDVLLSLLVVALSALRIVRWRRAAAPAAKAASDRVAA